MKKQIAKIKQHVSQNKETIILTAVSVTAIVVGLAVVTKPQIDENHDVMENPEVKTAFDIFELAAKNLDETIYKVKNENKNTID